jgi:hypothetical protein
MWSARSGGGLLLRRSSGGWDLDSVLDQLFDFFVAFDGSAAAGARTGGLASPRGTNLKNNL